MVLVVGDISVDITAPLAAHPVVGEDCLSPELTIRCGGVGLNAAVMLRRLDVPVQLLGCVGEDWFGRFAVECAASEGMNTRFIQRSGAAMTGLFLIAVSPDGQRTFFGSRGASSQLRMTDELSAYMNEDGDGIGALQIAGYAFLSESSRQCARRLIQFARERCIWTALDLGLGPSRQIPEVLKQVVGEVATVFANVAEAEALTGERAAETAMKELEQAGAREVVLKLGADGCLFRSGDKLCRAPAFAVNVVDTTGAGDAFTAGFVAGRTWGWATEECALLANACGAAASATAGAGQNLPTMGAVERLLHNIGDAQPSKTGSSGVPLIEMESICLRLTERLRSRRQTESVTPP